MSDKIKVIKVQDLSISVVTSGANDFICITDIANSKDGTSRAADIIKIGLGAGLHLNFLAHGNSCTIPILKWSNLTTLKCRQVCRALY